MSGRAAAVPAVRERWKIGLDARALVLVVAALQAFGLAVLYSASASEASRQYDASAYYLTRQLTGVLAGIVVFAIAAKLDAERWRKWAWPLMLISIVLMLVTILPFTTSIAPRINGSRRWVLGFQPSELAKVAVVVWTAMLIVKKADKLRRLTKGILPFVVIVGFLGLLAVLEPDLSAAMMFTLITGIVLFAGGVRIGHFVALGVCAVPLLWHEVQRLQYTLLRITAFLDPGAAPLEAGHQLRQSLIAVGSGEWLGVGFGEGRQQNGFVPYPYSDFIGSNVGEEWGFFGMLVLIIAFALYTYLGFRIAAGARSPFLRLVAIGVTTTTAVTAFLHIGVVVGLVPTTGLTLPFFSYGRSNLLVSFLMTGILVNIGSERVRVFGERATNPVAVPA
ncbi:MAG: putative lipid II flippase FtsW [Gemmatimonadota bacterium]|nr:putative lipid II flippase FtsW [Gemmatimonadota bacterium]